MCCSSQLLAQVLGGAQDSGFSGSKRLGGYDSIVCHAAQPAVILLLLLRERPRALFDAGESVGVI